VSLEVLSQFPIESSEDWWQGIIHCRTCFKIYQLRCTGIVFMLKQLFQCGTSFFCFSVGFGSFIPLPTKMLKVPSTAPKRGAMFLFCSWQPQQTSIISNSMACHFSSFELPTNTMEKFIKWKNITMFHPHFPLQKNGLGSLHNPRVLGASLRNLPCEILG